MPRQEWSSAITPIQSEGAAGSGHSPDQLAGSRDTGIATGAPADTGSN
jgi:hypothetical protein